MKFDNKKEAAQKGGLFFCLFENFDFSQILYFENLENELKKPKSSPFHASFCLFLYIRNGKYCDLYSSRQCSYVSQHIINKKPKHQPPVTSSHPTSVGLYREVFPTKTGSRYASLLELTV